MKYVEHVKSSVLLILVILSLLLTFSIWSYRPNYQYIEESQVEQITVGETKDLHHVIKPYKVVVQERNQLTGTIANSQIDNIMHTLSTVKATEFNFIQSNFTHEKINSMIQTDNRMALFFHGEVPLNTFKSILEFPQSELPEVSFKYIVLDWNKFAQTNLLQLFFISEKNETLYSTEVPLSDNIFKETFQSFITNTVAYQEINRGNQLSLYVPSRKLELVQYTYYIDEIAPDLFKDVLFKDPNIVKKNIENMTDSKYTDGMSFMTSDTKTRTINYVYPASESFSNINESTLLQDSFEFVNEHGGLTGDYHYMYMNAPKHVVEYQLFLQGIPVFSHSTSTHITTTWGDNQIFRYKRPYYLLDMNITLEKTLKELSSGVEITKSIRNINEIDEIIVGYYLTQNHDNLLYTLEPSWFAIQDGNWTRIMTGPLGGVGSGLE